MWSSPVPLGQKQPQGMFPTPWGWCSRGHGQQDFNPLHCSVLPEVFFGDWGPSCLQIIKKLLPCSFGLIQYLSNDHPHTMRQHIAQSSRLRAIDGNLMFRSFPNNHINSFPLLFKLLADGLVYQVFSLVPIILWQLIGLAHCGGREWWIDWNKERKKERERNLREAEFWLGCRESACMHCGSWPMRRDSLFFSASLCSREATSGHDSQKTPSHVPRFWLCVKWLHTSLCPALHCIWSWMVRMEAAIVNSPRMEMSLVYPWDSDRVAGPSTLLSEHCRLFQQDKTVYVVPHAYVSGQWKF